MNTLFLLLAEFETAHVPIEVVAAKYLGLGRATAFQRAAQNRLPFPVLKTDSRKAPWLVDLRDVAEWIDRSRSLNRNEWEKSQ